MKIAYFSLSEVPSRSANSVQVVRMCAAMARAGHEVTLFCAVPRGSGTRPKTNAEKENDIQTIQSWYGITETFDVRPHRLGKTWFFGRFLYSYRTFADARAIIAGADIIYGRDIYSLLRTIRSGKPIIYEAHTPPPNLLKRLMLRRLFRASTFRHLVVVSQELGTFFSETYDELTESNIIVAPNGADIPKTEEKTRRKPSSETRPDAFETDVSAPVRSVGYVGNLLPHKGPAMVMEIAHSLPDLDIHIVGGMERDLEYWRSVAPDNVLFHGHVDQQTLAQYYRSFRIVIAPYQTGVEKNRLRDDTVWGSPLKLFEYMAHGCCIVASDLPVIRELLGDDSAAAVLCSPTNAREWVETITGLIADQNRRQALSEAARELFYSTYTRDARVSRVLQQ